MQKSYTIFKRDKFLLNCSSFLIVSFFSLSQVKFLRFKEFLYQNNLKIKFMKSKSIQSCLKNYLFENVLSCLKIASNCPTFIIKSNSDNFLYKISSLDKEFFTDYRIFSTLCFYRGTFYTSDFLYSLKSTHFSLSVLKTISSPLFHFIFFIKFVDAFLIAVLIFYLSIKNANK